ncbi:hypothetical protein KJ660_02125 [Candidatus Micrarchaeota archaeon]|nr:hypothetical protein [Candidatus Micrarchaeota archaeon]
MSLRRRVERKRLRAAIAGKMGTYSRQELVKATHPEIQKMFHPYSHKGPKEGYPLYQICHDVSKLPKETVANFVSVPELMRKLKQDQVIRGLLKRNPELETSFERSVWQAISERGVKSSKLFWQRAPKEYIDAIVKAAAGNPNPMNERIGEVAKKLFGGGIEHRTILDIGTFAGGTITSAVEKLSLPQRRLLTIVLVDVNSGVVRRHAVPALVKLGVPKQNIKVLPTSFYNAAVAFKKMPKPLHEKGERAFKKFFSQLTGKVDLITAGASTINFANDLSPLLKSVRILLKRGGVFADWEWGSAEARKRKVNTEELKRIKIWEINQKAVTEFDAYVSFLDFWLGFFNYPANVKKKLFEDIEHSREFDFMGWCERNVKWMEQERINAGKPILADPAGFRNRAYRTGDAMLKAARIHGFDVQKPSYPLANPGKKDTGNVNWLVVARKP